MRISIVQTTTLRLAMRTIESRISDTVIFPSYQGSGRKRITKKTLSLQKPTLNFEYLLQTPLASLYLFAEMVANFLTNMASRHGFGHGGAAGAGGQKAKTLIIIIILVLIIPFVALLFSGASTGAGGLYGNSTIGYAVRQSTYSFSQFIVLIMVLGALAIVLSLL